MKTTPNESELLESAVDRDFIVGLAPKPGFKGRGNSPQVVVVKARSIWQAKQRAVLKVKKGIFANRQMRDWVFTSIEAASYETGESHGEQSRDAEA